MFDDEDNYQNMSLSYRGSAPDKTSHYVEVKMTGEGCGELDAVLDLMTKFLISSGFTYVTGLKAEF